MWVAYALGAAVVAAVFVTITKGGLKSIDPVVSLAVQTAVALGVAWGAVAYRGQFGSLSQLGGRDWGLLALSGVLTGVSSLLLFLALQSGPASRVTPVDRTSLVFAAILAAVFLGEKITWTVGLGLGLMAAGAAVVVLARTD